MTDNVALQQVLTDVRQWTSANRISLRAVGALGGPEFEKFSRATEEILQCHPALSQLNGQILRLGNGGARLSTALVARGLMIKASECEDVGRVVADAVEFVLQDQTDVLTVVTFAGVLSEETIRLSDRIEVVPPSKLPRSETFSYAFPLAGREDDHRFFDFDGTSSTVAITYKWSLKPALLAGGKVFELPPPNPDEEREIGRAIVALVLGSTECVQRIHTYYEHLHPGYPWPRSGWSSHPATPTYRKPGAIDASLARSAMTELTRFREWEEFERLIRRLNVARAKHDYVDAHIDLGIVAECALTRGDGKETEILQRLRTRGAWLLGATPDERRSIAKQISELYDRRSSAAHKGRVDSASRDTFESDEAVCRRLMLTILKRGKFPHANEWSSIIYG